MANIPFLTPLDPCAYSLEYLLGFELDHDGYGHGQVVAFDDEYNHCTVRFENGLEVEVVGRSMATLGVPWRIDAELSTRQFETYRAEVDALLLELEGKQRELAMVQESLRREESRLRFVHGTHGLAITLQPKQGSPIH
jgi:hypothetical protein